MNPRSSRPTAAQRLATIFSQRPNKRACCAENNRRIPLHRLHLALTATTVPLSQQDVHLMGDLVSRVKHRLKFIEVLADLTGRNSKVSGDSEQLIFGLQTRTEEVPDQFFLKVLCGPVRRDGLCKKPQIRRVCPPESRLN